MVCIILSGFMGFEISNRYNQSKQSNSNKIGSAIDSKQKQIDIKKEKYKKLSLTEEEFNEAIQKAKLLKNNDVSITKQKAVKDFSKRMRIGSLITPYLNVVDKASLMVKQYKEPTLDNIMESLNGDNYFMANAAIVGDNIECYKDVHMVLKVTDETGKTTVVQPKSDYIEKNRDMVNCNANINDPNDEYSCHATIGDIFASKDIIPLKPKTIEVCCIFPDGEENSYIFNYKELNKL